GGEQQRGRAALERGQQRLRLVVAGVVGAAIAAAAAVLVVGIALERRRGGERQDHGAGRGVGPAEPLGGESGGVRHVARHRRCLRSFLPPCYSGVRSNGVGSNSMLYRRLLLLIPL